MAGELTFFFMDSFLVKLIPVSKVRIVAFWFWHWTSSDDISGKIEMQRILWCIYFKVHSRWLLLVLDKLWKGWVHLGQCRGWSPVASFLTVTQLLSGCILHSTGSGDCQLCSSIPTQIRTASRTQRCLIFSKKGLSCSSPSYNLHQSSNETVAIIVCECISLAH